MLACLPACLPARPPACVLVWTLVGWLSWMVVVCLLVGGQGELRVRGGTLKKSTLAGGSHTQLLDTWSKAHFRHCTPQHPSPEKPKIDLGNQTIFCQKPASAKSFRTPDHASPMDVGHHSPCQKKKEEEEKGGDKTAHPIPPHFWSEEL